MKYEASRATQSNGVSLNQHREVLSLAAGGTLPDTVDSTSEVPVCVVRELIEAGYLTAIDASSVDGEAYLNPRITMAGREYLNGFVGDRSDSQSAGDEHSRFEAILNRSAIGTAGVWSEIEATYGIPKKTFGKKISFVKDRFKRKVIFRDVEQAFLLAEYGFTKPSVILAGGVIEELLRLYLQHKKVAPASDTLDSYIKTCETNDLLKGAIYRLADSIRQFRNIVHLARESSSKHTISKATAKGAVSSIFTIANDFDR